MKLDDVDMIIIENFLKGVTKEIEIARKVRLSPAGVHFRIKRLKELGILKGVKGVVDWKKLGFKINAYILIYVDVSELKSENYTQEMIVEDLREFSFVEEAFVVSGEADVIAKIRAKDTRHLRKILLETIQTLPGVKSTKTIVILE